MKVTFYGNSCFSLFHNGIHILCDPWLDGPACSGRWDKFPPSTTRVKDLPPIDYIYVSHIHSDHCERETMKALPKHVPVIFLERSPALVRRMLVGYGFETLCGVDEGFPAAFEGFNVETFGCAYEHTCGEMIDSSVVFDFGDHVVLNCNDNAPGEAWCHKVKAKYPKIDLAFLPAGGGCSYPAMYDNLTGVEKQDEAKKAWEKYAAIFIKAVDILKPTTTVPVGEGYFIRGPGATLVNYFQPKRVSPPQNVREQPGVVLMQPEMEMLDGVIWNGVYHEWTAAQVENHFAIIEALPTPKLLELNTMVKEHIMFKLMCAAKANLELTQKHLNMYPDWRISLDLGYGDQPFEMSFAKDVFIKQENHLALKLDHDTMLEWLLGLEDFNMLESGHRITFNRTPNVYCQEVYYLLSLFRI